MRPFLDPRQWRERLLLFMTVGFLGLAAGAILTAAASAQTQDFEPLNPFESGSSLLGLTDSAPMVRYNEFTGNVTVSLDVGVPGLQVPIQYARERQGQLQRYGVAGSPESGMGSSWHVGYGFVQAKRPFVASPSPPDCDPQNESVCAHGAGWAAVVEPNGAVTDFYRDSLFQSLPDATRPVSDEAHFLDSSLRRLTRDRSRSFTQAPFVLLSADGTRTTYEPVYVLSDPADLHMRFYPTEIEAPNGRVMTLTYGGTSLGSPRPAGALDFDRPLLSVRDSWGRQLELVYYSASELQTQLGAGAGPEHLDSPKLKEVRLEHSADQKLLASFEYTLADADGGSVVTLARHVTPEGYVTGFQYGSFSGYDHGIPLLERVDLRTGGSVVMSYQVFTQLDCQPSDFTGEGQILQNPLLRLETFSHSGDVYRYDYSQHTSGSLDGTVQVNVSTHSGRYSRLTDYLAPRVKEFPGGVACQLTVAELAKPRLRLTGQPSRRVETYVDRDGLATSREEVWTYQAALLNANDAVALRRDEAELYAVVPIRYSRRFDGECADGAGGFTPGDVWIDTDFTYDLWPGTSEGNLWPVGHPSMAAGDFLRPVGITRSVRTSGGSAGDAIVQSFDYLNRVTAGHTQDAVIADQEYAIGLATRAEAWFRPASGADQPLGRVETDFETSYQVRTLPSAQREYRSSDELIETRWQYYDLLESWAGLLRSERRGPAVDETGYDVASYSFGQPTRVVPVEGPETSRIVHWDGTVTTETEAGVQRDFFYDLDRRLIRTERGLDWSSYQRYSGPSEVPYSETWQGFGTNDQSSFARQDLDAWGRSVAGMAVIDQVPYVQASTATAFNPIGLVDASTGPAGARVESRFDVFGLEVETHTFAADGSELAHVTRQQTRRCDGTTSTRTVRRTHAVGAAETTTVVTDLAGRPVRAGTNEDAYLASLDPGDGGFTTVTYSAQLLDGQVRNVVTLSPYGLGNPQVRRSTWSDWQGRVVREDHPETGTVLHHYDGHGRRVLTQHASGRSERWLHDRAGRVIEHHGCPAVGACKLVGSFGYSPENGQLQSASTGDEVFVDISFDARQRPTQRTLQVPSLDPGPGGLTPNGEMPSGSVQLSWSALPDSVFYQVQALQGGEPVWKANGVASTTVTMPEGVWAGHGELTWRVRSFDVDHAPTGWSEGSIREETTRSDVRLSGGGTLDFGSLEVGQWADRSVILTNVGTADAVGEVLGLAAPFSVVDGASYTLAPGESLPVTVRFAPGAAATYAAQAELTAADSPSVFLDLSGRGETVVMDSLTVSPPVLSFPSTDSGTSQDLSFSVTNGGTGRAIGSVTGLAAPFQVIAGGTFDLGPGQVIHVTVRFAPTAAGSFSDQAQVSASGAEPVIVSVSGTATEDAPEAGFEIRFQGSPINDLGFGQLQMGASETKTLEIHNPGDEEIFVSGGVTPPFTSTFTGTSIPAGGSRHADVSFSAIQSGTFAGQATFHHGGDSVSIALSAEVVDRDLLGLNPSDVVVFPDVVVTGTSPAYLTIVETQGDPITVEVSTEGDFINAYGGGLIGLSEFQSFPIQLWFRPQRIGTHTGRICFTVQGQEDCVNMVGEALPALSVSPSSLDLGTVATGRRISGTLQLSKSIGAQMAGEVTLPPPFQAGGGTLVPFTLPGGGAQTLDLPIDLAPTAAGVWSGGAVVTAERGESVTVALTGRAVDPEIDGPTLLPFGGVQIGETGAQTLTVDNPTEVAVRARLVLTGGGAAAFTVPAAVDLPPFGSADLPIVYAPAVVGVGEAVLELRHAPPAVVDLGLDQRLLQVSLTGLGTDQALKRPWAGELYRSFLDPSTGYHVAQLTETGGDHLALFSFDQAFEATGRWVIYRHLMNASASTLTYRRLEIETGTDVALTATGLTNLANVAGDQLYALARASVSAPYTEVRRLSIETPPADGLGELLLDAPGEIQQRVAVNADRSAFLYLLVDPAQADDTRNVTLRAHHLGNPVDGSFDAVIATGGTRAGHRLRIVETHPTDPNRFLLRTDAQGMAAVRVGRLDSGALAPLSGYDPRFDAFTVLGDALFGAEGKVHLSLAQAAYPSTDPDLLVQLEASFATATLGLVTEHDAARLAAEHWQHALRPGRAAGWFAGGGASASYGGFGEPFIQLVRAAYDGDASTDDIVERFRLAGSLGADQQSSGSRHANARLLPTLDAVLFAAPWDAVTGTATDPALGKNLFLVRLPPRVRARLRGDTVLDGAEGPFRHGVRAVASSAGWSLDHGSPAGLGDGFEDQQAPVSASLPGATHFALADLDGDGVSDRIEMRREALVGWRVRAILSREDGSLAAGAPEVERLWRMDVTRPPVFGDVDGDGLADLVVVDTDGVVNSLRWRAFRNGAASLPVIAAETQIRFGYLGDPALDLHVFAADVNGDGYADRTVARHQDGVWRWLVDHSGAEAWGDNAIDTGKLGGDNTVDTPHLADIDGDGYADALLSRRQTSTLRWFASLSNASGLGASWDWSGDFGDASAQAVVAPLGRFTTRD